ncbi:MAG: methyltransferase domain-containing protein [Anaerolineales bacterium]|nr:methyltransferase domain-containing protein [Anaerolineales bacterium]
MSGFWRKQLRNRLALLPYVPAAEWHFRQLRRQGLFAPIAQLAARYGAGIPTTYPGAKYLHRYPSYLRENVARGVQLRLAGSSPLRILDLGCGPGYFLLVCRAWGHTVMGLDVAGNQIFDRLIAELSLPRYEMAVRAGAPLPAEIGQYDLITAFSIDFDEKPLQGVIWAEAEWTAFLTDIAAHLPAGGRLFLRLNLDKYGLQTVRDRPVLWTALSQHPQYDCLASNHRDVLLRRR